MREKIKSTDISLWQSFLAVAEHGNYSKASTATGTTISQLSKQVAKLEENLGVRLFQRTTRVVGMTEEATLLRPKIESILQDLKSAEAMFDQDQEITGTIKVSCVPYVAHSLLIPVIHDFRELYPKIALDFQLTKKFEDMIDSGVDLAIRIENPKDTSFIYRKLAPNELTLCAAPKYLEKRTAISTPDDLVDHDLLTLGVHSKCKFKGTSTTLGKYVSPNKIKCDNGVFLTQLALEGCGVLVRATFAVQKYLDSGQLVRVLPDHQLETFGHIHAVIPSKRYLAARVRLFLDFLVERSSSWS